MSHLPSIFPFLLCVFLCPSSDSHCPSLPITTFPHNPSELSAFSKRHRVEKAVPGCTHCSKVSLMHSAQHAARQLCATSGAPSQHPLVPQRTSQKGGCRCKQTQPATGCPCRFSPGRSIIEDICRTTKGTESKGLSLPNLSAPLGIATGQRPDWLFHLPLSMQPALPSAFSSPLSVVSV